MYDIDLSTLLLIGLDDDHTKIITCDSEFIVNFSSKKIIDNSCRYFGSNLNDKIGVTKRLIKVCSKSPIIIEETRNIIFFPLKSTRDKNNIWISFNNLLEYHKKNHKTLLKFIDNKEIFLDFSYYIIDNQVTRSMMLDYELKKRRESLKK